MSTQPQPVAKLQQRLFTNAGADGDTFVMEDLSAIGIRPVMIVEEVVFDADDEIALDQIIPADMKTVGIIVNPKTAFTVTTGSHLALGDGTDVDHFFEITKGTVDAKNETYKLWLTTPDIAASDITLTLTTTNGSQVKTGTASGTLQIAVLGYTLPSVEDAE